jgi:hypothetical protein
MGLLRSNSIHLEELELDFCQWNSDLLRSQPWEDRPYGSLSLDFLRHEVVLSSLRVLSLSAVWFGAEANNVFSALNIGGLNSLILNSCYDTRAFY